MSKLNITYVESNIDDDTVESCVDCWDANDNVYCVRSFDTTPGVWTVTPAELSIVPAKLARFG